MGVGPAGGVDVERGEDARLERVAAGDELDPAAGGVEGDGVDAAELAQGAGGGEVLVGEVGIAHVGVDEGASIPPKRGGIPYEEW